MSLNKEQQAKLEYSGYRFVGEHGHAAAKVCHWTRKAWSTKESAIKRNFME